MTYLLIVWLFKNIKDDFHMVFKKLLAKNAKQNKLVSRPGFEPATICLGARRSTGCATGV